MNHELVALKKIETDFIKLKIRNEKKIEKEKDKLKNVRIKYKNEFYYSIEEIDDAYNNDVFDLETCENLIAKFEVRKDKKTNLQIFEIYNKIICNFIMNIQIEIKEEEE